MAGPIVKFQLLGIAGRMRSMAASVITASLYIRGGRRQGEVCVPLRSARP